MIKLGLMLAAVLALTVTAAEAADHIALACTPQHSEITTTFHDGQVEVKKSNGGETTFFDVDLSAGKISSFPGGSMKIVFANMANIRGFSSTADGSSNTLIMLNRVTGELKIEGSTRPTQYCIQQIVDETSILRESGESFDNASKRAWRSIEDRIPSDCRDRKITATYQCRLAAPKF